MMIIAVLASTNGTDLQAIIDEIKAGRLDVNLGIVLANKDCFAVQRARDAGFKALVVKPDKGENREVYDRRIADILEKEKIELVVLVGYMRIFSSWFVKKFENRIMNIHPSILPSFPGMDLSVHEAVLEHGCKLSGCTIHFVDEGTDSGPIIIQECVSVKNDETSNSLKKKVQNLEKKLYPKAIRLFAKGKIRVEGRRVFVDED